MPPTYHSPVFHGNKQGRTISFPTINLDPTVLPADTPTGVYSSRVTIGNHSFIGALYFGPRLVNNETHTILEIYLLDFSEEIYGETISFTLNQFIRPVIHFKSLEAMKAQITQDVSDVRAAMEHMHQKNTK